MLLSLALVCAASLCACRSSDDEPVLDAGQGDRDASDIDDAGASDASATVEVGDAPECDRFELIGDLAHDPETGLTWTRNIELLQTTHEAAAAACAERGMRLPVRAELESLIDMDAEDCKLPCGFYGHRCATLICDTQIAGSEDHWGVSFAAAALVLVPATTGEGFVCVR